MKTETPQEKNEGLQVVDRLDRNMGMLFTNDGENPRICMTMKGVTYPIDIIFIKNDKVLSAAQNVQPKDPSVYCDQADHVLEINGGLCEAMGIEEGDEFVLSMGY